MKLSYTLRQPDMVAMMQNYAKTQPRVKRMFRLYRAFLPLLLALWLGIRFVGRVRQTGWTIESVLALLGVVGIVAVAAVVWAFAVKLIRTRMMKSSASASYPAEYASRKTLELQEKEIYILSDTNGETKESHLAYTDITAIKSDETHYFLYFGQGAVAVIPFLAFNPKEQKDKFMLELEQKRERAAAHV